VPVAREVRVAQAAAGTSRRVNGLHQQVTLCKTTWATRSTNSWLYYNNSGRVNDGYSCGKNFMFSISKGHYPRTLIATRYVKVAARVSKSKHYSPRMRLTVNHNHIQISSPGWTVPRGLLLPRSHRTADRDFFRLQTLQSCPHSSELTGDNGV
jgi:hypothetical protein